MLRHPRSGAQLAGSRRSPWLGAPHCGHPARKFAKEPRAEPLAGRHEPVFERDTGFLEDVRNLVVVEAEAETEGEQLTLTGSHAGECPAQPPAIRLADAAEFPDWRA